MIRSRGLTGANWPLARWLPFLTWWPRVNRQTLRADLTAGLTGGIITVPQGVAFATIAGMPPEYGLYAAMVPPVIAALFGSSWHLVSGPTTAISIVVFESISPFAEPGSSEFIHLVLTLTLLTGLIQLALGLLRLGSLVNFISHTVVVGFTAGAAILIAASQIKNFFGLDIARGTPFYEILHQSFVQAGHINPYVTGVALVTLLSGIGLRHFYPRFPYMIGAMLIGSLFALVVNHFFGLQQTRISTIGALSSGLPPLSIPDLSLTAIGKILPIALAVAMLGLTQAVSIARSIAMKSEQRIDGNQEFIGQGLSNVVGCFFSAYPSSGSFNRSGPNYEAGAGTPLAAVFSSLFLVVILLLVAPLAKYLPTPAMAGLLFLVAWGLIDFHLIRDILRTTRPEGAVLVTTFVATLLAEMQFAIYAGVILSLMLYLNRTSRPGLEDVKPHQEAGSYHFDTDTGVPDCPQLKMLRLNGSIFFGAVSHVQNALHEIDEHTPTQKHVLITAAGINFVDIAGAEMLVQESKRRRRVGGGLYFYNMKEEALRLLRKGGYVAAIGEESFFPMKANAVGAIYPKLDSDICRGCGARIFPECNRTLPNGEKRKEIG